MRRILVPLFTLGLGLAFLPPAAAEKTPAPAAEKSESTAIDPICGMKVEKSKAAATATYQGKTYYFCSKGEKATFEKDPAKYVKK